MKVLLAGATGFTGSRIAACLLEAGHRVRCFTRPGSDRGALGEGTFEFACGDLRAARGLAEALRGMDAFLCAASLGFGHGPPAVSACVSSGVRRAVFFSTTAVFTRLDVRSKSVRLRAEAAIRDSGLDWTILRPTMIYGDRGDRNVERLLSAAARWPALPVVGDGLGKVQPVFVDDLAALAVRTLESPRSSGRAYQVPGRRAMPLAAFLREAFLAVGRRPRVVRIPPALAVCAARVAEVVLERPPLRAEQVMRLLEDKDFDLHAASVDLGYDPVDPARGLRIEAHRLGLSGGSA